LPASGYFEWKTVNGAKQPFYFSAADGGVLSIAGLWVTWNGEVAVRVLPVVRPTRDGGTDV
jgi:putative SOS response-associated peptidase YedK